MSILNGGIYQGLIHHKQITSAFTVVLSSVSYSVSSFTVPNGVFSLNVQCWGGGAGGEGMDVDGNNNYGGDGGGGGGYAMSNINVTPGSTYNYQIGSGGTRGYQPSQYPGSGGTTWFGGTGITNATIRAGGGGETSPGQVQTNGGGVSITNIGDITYIGGYGQAGSRTVSPYKTGGGGSGAGSGGTGNNGSLSNGNGGAGTGGASVLSFGGSGGTGYAITNPAFPEADYGNGGNGQFYGAGGGGAGAIRMPAYSGVYGGSGATGLIIITYNV